MLSAMLDPMDNDLIQHWDQLDQHPYTVDRSDGSDELGEPFERLDA